MIEEYENWEDSIRRTFIELADYMDKITDPLEAIIDFAWAAGADLFWVNNAKDELKRLKKKELLSKEMSIEAFRANQFAIEEMKLYLEGSKELSDIKESLANPVAWARINERGDLFDLRLQNNPYVDQNKVVPLYRIKQ